MKTNLEKLDSHYDTYRKRSSYDDAMRFYTFQTFRPFISDKKALALEFGCSDGQMTQWISEQVGELDVVEGSIRFLQQAKERNLHNVFFTHSLFEDFESGKRYDYIFATYVITHVTDITAFFNKAKSMLKSDGLLFIAVPNARVLSRQLALHMGLLQDLFLLSENDRNHGHCRSYDRVRLERDLDQNGLRVIAKGGILLKPLADFQMDKLIEDQVLKREQMEGLYKLGLEYPDLSGAIYAICKIAEI